MDWLAKWFEASFDSDGHPQAFPVSSFKGYGYGLAGEVSYLTPQSLQWNLLDSLAFIILKVVLKSQFCSKNLFFTW